MKIAVAMSGGVDSTAAAFILKNQGHEVTGISVLMFQSDDITPVEKAESACSQLDIPFIPLDLSDEFENRIVDPFCREYLEGKTPSPCIRCNRMIKFGSLLDHVLDLGFDSLATGHYASVKYGDGRYYIAKGRDNTKDQSYFLFGLTQSMLSGITFPLEDFTKDEIRLITDSAGLHAAKSKESQEICFIPDNDYKHFIESRISGTERGDITDTEGKVLGSHEGIHRYTIGQRRGLGISHSEPLYVVDIITKENRIVAGPKELLFKNGLIAQDVNFQKQISFNGETVFAKIRSTHPPVEARAFILEDGTLRVEFLEKTQQISPGQAAVLYDSAGNVLAGGWITGSF